MALFRDRADAGRQLAERLQHLRGHDLVIVGLPRGGVPVAAEVARGLGAPLDVIVVRKLGVPFQPELGMGAIGEDGVRVIDDNVVRMARVGPAEMAAVEARERQELQRRAQRFRSGRPRVPLAGREVVVVDDGIATGSTARAACRVARAEGAARVVLAVPVAPVGWQRELADAADELICVHTPELFFGIGQFYGDFTQTGDEQVLACLDRSSTEQVQAAPVPADDPAIRDADVQVPAGPVTVHGHLTVPDAAGGVVVFAHGSGSSRHSPRNRHLARLFNDAGLATLLFDLLTADEERQRSNVFDVDLLGRRLVEVTRWVRAEPEVKGLRVGYLGASTGAAAALWAAAEPGSDVAAVVSRGGRPDLAGPRLAAVQAPTLLVVGGLDSQVLQLNREALARLRCLSRLEVVPGATHLFEEPGTLQAAAALARDWFRTYLAAADEESGRP